MEWRAGLEARRTAAEVQVLGEARKSLFSIYVEGGSNRVKDPGHCQLFDFCSWSNNLWRWGGWKNEESVLQCLKIEVPIGYLSGYVE